MEARSPSVSGSDLISQFHLPFDLPPAALNLYSILREGVDIDVQALKQSLLVGDEQHLPRLALPLASPGRIEFVISTKGKSDA